MTSEERRKYYLEYLDQSKIGDMGAARESLAKAFTINVDDDILSIILMVFSQDIPDETAQSTMLAYLLDALRDYRDSTMVRKTREGIVSDINATIDQDIGNIDVIFPFTGEA